MSLTWYRIGELVRVACDERVLDVPPAHAVSPKEHQRAAHEVRKADHFLVGSEVELIKHCVVFGQVLVLLLPGKPGTVGWTGKIKGGGE